MDFDKDIDIVTDFVSDGNDAVLKKIALIGRSNVGKSTIFNKLTKTLDAIVNKEAGITRDRKEGVADLSDISFILIDTAGVDVDTKNDIAIQMNEQSMEAIKDANLVFFVLNSKDYNIDEEKKIADFIRSSFKKIKKNKPVILIANKSENLRDELFEFNTIGFGDVTYISAEHNIGFSDLYNRISEYFDKSVYKAKNYQNNKAQNNKIKLAIVGRPNVGKSTFINSIVKENRVITSDKAGTTTDAIPVSFVYNGKKIEIIDTAGKRKNTNISDNKEKMFVEASERAIKDAHVVVLVVDACIPFEKQDLLIADSAVKEGKGIIIALNKWDLIDDEVKPKFLSIIKDKIGDKLANIYKIVPISAKDSFNVDKVIEGALSIYDMWNKKIITNKLNIWLNLAVNDNPPKSIYAGIRPRLNFIKQVGIKPPTFTIFGSRVSNISADYVRYLENSLKTRFHLENVPVRILFRQKNNPYNKSDSAENNKIFNNNKRDSNKISKEYDKNINKNNKVSKGRFVYSSDSDSSYSSLADNLKNSKILSQR